MTTGVVFKRINVIITWCVALARRLVPKVGERSCRARTASYGVTGPAFDDDCPEATVSCSAQRILGNVDFGAPFRGERRKKKHAKVLAGGTDKMSSLSHDETSNSNQQNYCLCWARQCWWHSHATWKFPESEGGSCCLYPILYLQLGGSTTSKQLE